jgi:ABC-2 type transport system permease protein
MIDFAPVISAALEEAAIRFRIASRYPGQLVLEILVPLVLTAMPLLLGRAVAGSHATANFTGNTGTSLAIPYLLIGAVAFIVVNRAFWDLAYWIRYEQETGTLEAIYLTPTSSLTLMGGVTLYSATRSMIAGAIAYFVGCEAFGVNPFVGNLILAFLFMLLGLLPLYAISLIVAAIVLRVRESSKLMSVMQWGASFLMGVFYPVTVLPTVLRALAMAFPPTWMVNGVRSSMLGVGYFLGTWYLDLAVLWGATLLMPALAVWVFRRAERNVRSRAGLGHF